MSTVTVHLIIERDDEPLSIYVTGEYRPGNRGDTLSRPEDGFPEEPDEFVVEAITGEDDEPLDVELTDAEHTNATVEAERTHRELEADRAYGEWRIREDDRRAAWDAERWRGI